MSLEIFHLTDPHFGCADEAALAAAAKMICERKPRVVIMTGDISIDGLSHELELACQWMRNLPVPVMLTPGNHDVPYYNVFGRIFFPWARYTKASRGLKTLPWHTPEFSIVPINTARGIQLRANWAQGAISERQIEEASAELAKAQPGALRIVITHHPLDWPNDAPIKGATLGGARAIPRLMDAGAELFLSGHLHFASARLINCRALAITSGTLSKRVRHEPCAFTILRRPSPRTIETEIVHVKNGVAESAAVRRFELTQTGAVEAAVQPPQPAPVSQLPG